ncbi:uncharacterized protein LOC131606323 [Vicia villosa]|uniref:uncharacterized protein LOC131606323 n=1 Tax=Vicia villosa TaxID=3911 RepID=UPI00273C8F4A|nr:uncharacterized protein LOC131606323 [Vicia villosa]
MAKQSKSKKPESFGKGKVTPIQIAFIVDRYLCDNNFTQTRKSFRIEASSFIANSPINEVPKSLMSLGEMLDEYICLKEQKVMLDQERVYMEQEKNRVQMFLNGVQNVMNVYNASKNFSLANGPMPNAKSAAVPQQKIGVPSAPVTATAPTSTQNPSNMLSVPAENGNFSTPMISVSDRKRKDTRTVDAPSIAKRSRGRSSCTSRKVPVLGQNTLPQSNSAVNNQVVYHPSSVNQSSAANFVPSGSQVQGSSVVKCLFNQPQKSIPSNSQVPKTPPRANSSHSDTNISPPEVTQVPPSNAETTSTCYTVISTKRVMVSPAKQMAYIESSHCISPVKMNPDKATKREHVRSRLNFDSSDIPQRLDSDKSLPNEISTTETNNEAHLYDIDFPNFDALNMDFSFAEMLNDLDFSCEGLDFSCDPTPSHSNDNQVISEQPSTLVEALSEKNMNIQGTDSLTATASVTRNITIVSPEKKHQSCSDQENC